jgi:hypothetical protein
LARLRSFVVRQSGLQTRNPRLGIFMAMSWNKGEPSNANGAVYAPLMAEGIVLPETVIIDDHDQADQSIGLTYATAPYEGSTEHVATDIATTGAPISPTAPYYSDDVVPQSNEATLLLSTEVDESSLSSMMGPQFRDVPFALFFLLQIGVMLYAGIFVAPKGFDSACFNITAIEKEISDGNDDITDEDMKQIQDFIAAVTQYVMVYPERILCYLIIPSCIGAFIIAYIVTAAVVKPCSKLIVYSCLLGTVGWTIGTTLLLAVAVDNLAAYVFAAGVIGVVVYFVAATWKLVPFAAVNLKVALEGISRNCGMYVVACLFAELGFVWVIYWLYTVVGVSIYENDKCEASRSEDHLHTSSDQHDDQDCGPPFVVVVAFLLSLYWTSAVIMVCFNS